MVTAILIIFMIIISTLRSCSCSRLQNTFTCSQWSRNRFELNSLPQNEFLQPSPAIALVTHTVTTLACLPTPLDCGHLKQRDSLTDAQCWNNPVAPFPCILGLCKEALAHDQSSSEIEQVASRCELPTLEGLSRAAWQGHVGMWLNSLGGQLRREGP